VFGMGTGVSPRLSSLNYWINCPVLSDKPCQLKIEYNIKSNISLNHSLHSDEALILG